MGMGRPSGSKAAAGYVLKDFRGEDLELFNVVLDRAADAVETFVREGLVTAMNRFNGPDRPTMNLSGLLAALRGLREYQSVLEALGDPDSPQLALRLQRSARIPVGGALAQDLDRPILYIAGRIDRAAAVLEELGAWAPAARVLHFAEPNPLFYEYAGWGPAHHLQPSGRA
jgi:hypothetical protein